MRLLLDTNVVVNAIHRPQLLSSEVADTVRRSSEVWFSAAVPWEIAIKVNVGKYPYAVEPLLGVLQEERFRELPISAAHGLAAGLLPLHHRDPFDRIMVAQARLEGLTLVSADRQLVPYDVQLLLT